MFVFKYVYFTNVIYMKDMCFTNCIFILINNKNIVIFIEISFTYKYLQNK